MTREDLVAVADLCARAVHNGKTLFRNFERPDRVFLNRAFEHVLARRARKKTTIRRCNNRPTVLDIMPIIASARANPGNGILRITAVHVKFLVRIWLVKILIRSSKFTFARSWRPLSDSTRGD